MSRLMINWTHHSHKLQMPSKRMMGLLDVICSTGHIWPSGRITRRCGARYDAVPALVVEEPNRDHLLRQPSIGAPTLRLHASPQGAVPGQATPLCSNIGKTKSVKPIEVMERGHPESVHRQPAAPLHGK
jgi:hypothetical protein